MPVGPLLRPPAGIPRRPLYLPYSGSPCTGRGNRHAEISAHMGLPGRAGRRAIRHTRGVAGSAAVGFFLPLWGWGDVPEP